MAKQFVTEIHQQNSVVILLNGVDAKRYNRNPAEFEGYNNPLLDGVGEYEEITEGNKVHYWIRVPDLIINSGNEIKKIPVLSSYEKRQKEKYELIRRKKERMARYSEMIRNGDEIVPTAEDVEDGLKLKKLQNRKESKKKKLVKNTLVSMLNPEVFEDDYFPDNLV